jgi:hypothetical protein
MNTNNTIKIQKKLLVTLVINIISQYYVQARYYLCPAIYAVKYHGI